MTRSDFEPVQIPLSWIFETNIAIDFTRLFHCDLGTKRILHQSCISHEARLPDFVVSGSQSRGRLTMGLWGVSMMACSGETGINQVFADPPSRSAWPYADHGRWTRPSGNRKRGEVMVDYSILDFAVIREGETGIVTLIRHV
jgi:hypothetical protein